jgi:DNA-binding HxlR family transcriptional regulator
MDGFINSRIVMRGDVTCPIALAATVLSDQWTVIVLRDIAFFNQRTFGAILENNNEKIPRPTLANRLKRLCDIGLLKARSDAKHAQRKVYSLTERALGLLPLMVGMGNWTLNQKEIKTPEIEFLRELSGSESQAMKEYIDKLRTTHAVN